MNDRPIDITDGLPEPIISWLEGDASRATLDAVERWLEESPQRRETLEELRSIWSASRLPEARPALEDLHDRLDRADRTVPRDVQTQPRHEHRSGWRAVLRIAAVLVVGLGLGLIWPHLRAAIAPTEYAKVVVPAGSQSTLELPNGVEVQLNYATELAYDPTGDGRDLYLEGEAFFKVPDGATRTLRVHTEAGVVRDLGTEFNVHARDGRTAVTVTDGLVELENALGHVSLEAGQSSSATVARAPSPAAQIRLETATDWLEGRLVFYDEPLARVAQELERRYGVSFDVHPALGGVRINAEVQPEMSARDALAGICVSIQARCQWQDDSWQITPGY